MDGMKRLELLFRRAVLLCVDDGLCAQLLGYLVPSLCLCPALRQSHRDTQEKFMPDREHGICYFYCREEPPVQTSRQSRAQVLYLLLLVENRGVLFVCSRRAT